MRCCNCNNLIHHIEKNYYNFCKDKPILCRKCETKYLPGIYLSKIPIKNYFIWHFYISEVEIPNEQKNGFNQYFKPFYLLALHSKKIIIVLEELQDNELFAILDLINFEDIIIISYGAERI